MSTDIHALVGAYAVDALDRTGRYAVLWRVHTAATEQTRANRIAAVVERLAGGREPS